MARVTLRLPDSLHAALARRAREEGVSMNQYLVYTLSKAATLDSVARQRARFEEMLNAVPEDEAEETLQTLLAARAS